MAGFRSCSLVLLAISLLHVASAETQTNTANRHFYEELGCQSVGGDLLTYDCGHLKSRDATKCYFRNAEVAGDNAAGEAILGSCLADCRCMAPSSSAASAEPILRCANIECPNLFHRDIVPAGCEMTYSDDRCCNDGIICDPSTPDPKPTVYTRQNYNDTTFRCSYGNETYLEGTKFYPHDAPCSVCYCRQGFNGKVEAPFCRDIVCGFELHYADKVNRGCAPTFWGNGCCAIAWRCPEATDRVITATETGTQAEGTCQWGALTLKRGESLSSAEGSSRSKCSCTVPPFVTCQAGEQT